jgi:hypothetical protein
MAKLNGAIVGAIVLVFLSTAMAKAGTQPPSCAGDRACQGNTGQVAPGSCDGPQSCEENSGSIGPGSCNGYQACTCNTAPIGPNQCNTPSACRGTCVMH